MICDICHGRAELMCTDCGLVNKGVVMGKVKIENLSIPKDLSYFNDIWQMQAKEADPTGRDPHSAGAKLDAGKPLPWLMLSGFPNAMQAVADVTTKGARKYTPNGWKHVPGGAERYMEAFARHMLALAAGETTDADTGCLHKAQMIWNLMASLEIEFEKGRV